MSGLYSPDLYISGSVFAGTVPHRVASIFAEGFSLIFILHSGVYLPPQSNGLQGRTAGNGATTLANPRIPASSGLVFHNTEKNVYLS